MPDTGPTSLSVLIPTAGQRPELLERTLRHLAQCQIPSIYKSTIVIENGPQKRCESIVQQYTTSLNAQYLHHPQPNKSLALNVALGHIDSEFIFFADDDIRASPATLTAYVQAAHAHPTHAYFGGPVSIDHDGPPPPDWLKGHLPTCAVGMERSVKFDRGPGDHFLGFNWAAYATDIKQLGGFNINRGPGAIAGGQETDMQNRLAAAGCPGIFVPDARVWHWVPANRCSLQWTLKRYYRNGIYHGLQAAQDHRLGCRYTGPFRYFASLSLLTTYHTLRHLFSPPEQRRFMQQLHPALLRGIRDGYNGKAGATKEHR